MVVTATADTWNWIVVVTWFWLDVRKRKNFSYFDWIRFWGIKTSIAVVGWGESGNEMKLLKIVESCGLMAFAGMWKWEICFTLEKIFPHSDWRAVKSGANHSRMGEGEKVSEKKGWEIGLGKLYHVKRAKFISISLLLMMRSSRGLKRKRRVYRKCK